MTLPRLEAIRDQIKAQYNAHTAAPAVDGKDALKHCNAIEILSALRVLEQLITEERVALAAPPGATGPAGI